ncbi:MAG: ABC transporter permease [Halobacteriota archaeon]|uniref:ABC transporter permease n=1 Tax=Natronomonas sp. TaxID=2184060 RepID=UPI0039754932
MTSVRDRIERLLGALLGLSASGRILLSLAAVAAAIAVGMGIILAAGSVAACSTPKLALFGVEFCYDPIEVYAVLLGGAFGNPYNVAATLQRTTLLLCTGLSFAIAYKAGLFNIGAQGQFVLGSLATAVVVLALAPFAPAGRAGGAVLVPAGILAGCLVGGLYGFFPGFLKVQYDTNEVITTLLLNFIATAVAFVVVDRYFNDETVQGTATESIPDAATLGPRIFPQGSDFSLPVLVLVLGVVGVFFWLLTRTTIGYDIQTAGTQPKAAAFGGVDERFTTLYSMTLAGVVAGLGGALFVLMVLGRWQTGAPSVGFDGIAVSILAGNNPIGLIPSGLLFGALDSGSQAIEFQLAVPGELIDVLQGLIILFVATPELFRMLGRHLDRRGTIDLKSGGEKR